MNNNDYELHILFIAFAWFLIGLYSGYEMGHKMAEKSQHTVVEIGIKGNNP